MKKYVIFAGVNGSGKTTLYSSYPEIQDMPRINVDEIVRSFGSWENANDVMKAGRIAVKKLKEYFENGISFDQETTLCGKGILRNIDTAKEKGYTIDLYYVGVDSVQTAIDRVARRVAQGGHGIPESDIRRRYTESLDNLSKVLPKCDHVRIFDNTDKFRLIASYYDNECVYISSELPEWFMKVQRS